MINCERFKVGFISDWPLLRCDERNLRFITKPEQFNHTPQHNQFLLLVASGQRKKSKLNFTSIAQAKAKWNSGKSINCRDIVRSTIWKRCDLRRKITVRKWRAVCADERKEATRHGHLLCSMHALEPSNASCLKPGWQSITYENVATDPLFLRKTTVFCCCLFSDVAWPGHAVLIVVVSAHFRLSD